MEKTCGKRECPLWTKGPEVPFEKGRVNKIVGMGESPGKWEERKRKPFWFEADAGGLLRSCLKEVSLDYGDHFWCNSARCRIDKDSLSAREVTDILACCHDKAIAPIKLLKPKGVLLMGDFALRQVTRKHGITKQRGRWEWNEEFQCWVLPVFHPAYICRNMGLRKRLVDDFRMLKEFIDNDYAPPKVSKRRERNYKEVEDISLLIKEWEEREETVGFDTEAQGLDWLNPNFLMISAQFSPERGEAYEITLHEEVSQEEPHAFEITWPRRSGKGKKLEPTAVFIRKAPSFDKKLQSIADFLSSEKIKKYMMHGNHDLHTVEAAFKREELKPPIVRNYRMDVQAAANLYDENLFKMSSSVNYRWLSLM